APDRGEARRGAPRPDRALVALRLGDVDDPVDDPDLFARLDVEQREPGLERVVERLGEGGHAQPQSLLGGGDGDSSPVSSGGGDSLAGSDGLGVARVSIWISQLARVASDST